ncbi:MAG: choice-of-anchor tandem repeat NxxGxxAF-containing protein [Wenzhouxiangella sp.]|jgi:hypothetical protein|nr:choice-of-anchor tandem repeat NxxGxxAF-containing protein [Wenzhouxiangella sp.]
MFVRFARYSASLLALLLGSNSLSAVEFDVTTEPVVQTAQPAPDGNGVFSDTILFPILNDQGQVLIWARLVATTDAGPLDDWGFFLADRDGVAKVFRGGEPSAQNNALRLDPQAVAPSSAALSRPYALDASGRILLAAPDTSAALAIYRADAGSREVLVQEGDLTPIGTLTDLAATIPRTFSANDPGVASFTGIVAVQDQPFQFGLFRTDTGSFDALIFSGQSLPDGRSVANFGFQTTVFNNAGRGAGVVNTAGTGLDFGMYSSDGTTVDKLLHSGEPAPDGLGTLIAGAVISPQLNNSGNMLGLFNVDDITQDYVGLFIGDGSGLSEITRTGASIPTGVVLNFTGDIRINDNDTLVYGAIVTTPTGNRNQLLMRRAGVTRAIATAFDTLPEPIGLELRDPFAFALNEQDQVLFSAFVIAEGLSRQALFLFDPEHGLALVARAGQSFAGDVLAEIEVALPRTPSTMRYTHNAHTGFNNNGEAAFYFRLGNGQAGVALAGVEFLVDRPDELFRDRFELNADLVP